MEISAYLRIDGERQDFISGSGKRRDREDLVNIYSFKHEVLLPHQSQTHLGNGAVKHQPIVFTKEVDKSSPKLYQALVEKEELSITLQWYRFDGKGEEQLYYQIGLEKAYLIKVESWTPDANMQSLEHLRFMETVSIAYERIHWSWGADGATSYSTSWRGEL